MSKYTPSKYKTKKEEQESSSSIMTALGVRWFAHFPKDFLRSYGVPFWGVDEESMSKKISSVNTEMLNRPKIAISEFCQTIHTNIQLMEHLEETIQHLPKLIKRLKKLEEAAKVIDTTDETQGDKAQALNQVVAFLTRDSEFMDSLLPQLLEDVSAVYLTGIHTAVNRFLLRDLEFVSNISVLPFYNCVNPHWK